MGAKISGWGILGVGQGLGVGLPAPFFGEEGAQALAALVARAGSAPGLGLGEEVWG